MIDDDILLKPEQVCVRMGLVNKDGKPTVQTLAKWRHLEKGPPYTRLSPSIKSEIRYSKKLLEKYLADLTVDPGRLKKKRAA